MELRLLPMFICLVLTPLVIDAALPPELYWKSMLPNTTIPKSVRDLLSAGIVGKAIYNDKTNQMIFWPLGVTDQLDDNSNGQTILRQYASTDQSHDEENKILLRQQRLPTDERHHNPISVLPVPTDATLDKLPEALFFLESDLYAGKKMKLFLPKSPYSKILLPREVAETIPFSFEKLPEIFKMLSVEPGSEEADQIKAALHHCNQPPRTKLDEKHCATSLESMVDYIIEKLGKNVKAYSTEVEKDTTRSQIYTLGPVKKISNDVLACHQKHYPHVLLHCHKGGRINRAYFVPLEGSDGTIIKSIVVCHADTSEWDPNHFAFRLLNTKPGTAPVCHISPADNVVWVPSEDM